MPYLATASIAYLNAPIAELTNANSIRGTKFPHLDASCSTGLRHAPVPLMQATCTTVKSRGVSFMKFPTVSPVPENGPIDVYLEIQGRFKVMRPEAAAGFQNNIDKSRQRL